MFSAHYIESAVTLALAGSATAMRRRWGKGPLPLSRKSKVDQEHVSDGEAVVALRRRLGFSQALMGKALNCSAMEVSRMERGGKLSPHLCVLLGNLAGDPACWFFWERAGLRTSDVLRIVPAVQRRLRTSSLLNVVLRVVHAGAHGKVAKESDLVAIPLSPLTVAAHGGNGSNSVNWTEVLPTSMFATPRSWCPNPNRTVSFRVKGDSMMPTIPDGCIIVVDTASVNQSELTDQIVVTHNKRQGLILSRLRNIDRVAVLRPENPNMASPITLATEWTIVGKVLWWIVQDRDAASTAPEIGAKRTRRRKS